MSDIRKNSYVILLRSAISISNKFITHRSEAEHGEHQTQLIVIAFGVARIGYCNSSSTTPMAITYDNVQRIEGYCLDQLYNGKERGTNSRSLADPTHACPCTSAPIAIDSIKNYFYSGKWILYQINAKKQKRKIQI